MSRFIFKLNYNISPQPILRNINFYTFQSPLASPPGHTWLLCQSWPNLCLRRPGTARSQNPMDLPLYSVFCVKCAVCIVQCALCIMKCVMFSIQCVQCVLCSVQYEVSIVQCAVCSLKCAGYSMQCAVCILQCAVGDMQCDVFSVHFAVHIIFLME